MRRALVLLWMLFPVGVAAYHFNLGPKQMMREEAHAHLVEIRRLEQAEEPNWQEIVDGYNRLVELLTQQSSARSGWPSAEPGWRCSTWRGLSTT